MATGAASACLVAVMVVWSLGQHPMGQTIMINERIHNGSMRTTIHQTGVYLCSVTVDPDFNTDLVGLIVVKQNNVTMFTLYGHKIIANTAMFSYMRMNDVITVVGLNILASVKNFLSLAYVSDNGQHFAALTTLNLVVAAGQEVLFGKHWDPLQGWVTSSEQSFFQAQHTGIYWVTAYIKPVYPSQAAFSVSLEAVSNFGSYDVFTVWADLGRPVSCSGAVQLMASQTLTLTAKDEQQRLHSSSLLSFAYLSENGGRAVTARMFLLTNNECARINLKPRRFIVDKRSARHGHHNKGHGNATHSVQSRYAPGNNTALLELRYMDEEFILNARNMAVRGGNIISIPATGVYLVGIRPDSARTERISVVMHKNFQFIWQSYAEGTPSGETFAMAFNQSDTLIFYAYGSCTVERGTIVSVAFVQG